MYGTNIPLERTPKIGLNGLETSKTAVGSGVVVPIPTLFVWAKILDEIIAKVETRKMLLKRPLNMIFVVWLIIKNPFV